ncbi:MAG: RNA 3'-terminal phosphate cyclase [Candidatus Diapherotrites archaeon]|nr:RNA 3'-terminal phosphate cyclase [Candidatus Diapherotrites archaeon]
MIEIDGSTGHGGGQIIRTAAALSAIMGEPFRVTNIRAKRPNPGLRPQHLTGIKALAKLCDAKLDGAEIGSRELTFTPGKIKARKLEIDTGTAGSISLVLQTLLLPSFLADGKVELSIRGGTDVRWSPPIDYIKHVLLPLIKKSGYKADMSIKRRGYYPKGGGLVEVIVRPSNPKAMKLAEKTNIKTIKGISSASESLRKHEVAERQARAARKAIFEKLDISPEIQVDYSETDCPGSGITLWAETENSVIGANALGERGKPSEEVGREAALKLTGQREGVVDEWCADQLIPYMAMSGGEMLVSRITEHCRTNMLMTEKFTGKSFIVKENLISLGE